MRVILSEAELEQCKQAASKRTNYARSRQIKNQRVSTDKSDLSVDYIGMVGEMAVAKALGLSMNLDKVGVDNGIDFIYADLKVDVKTRSHPGSDLVFKTYQAFKAQVAILARFKREDCIDILGCMSRKRFHKYAKPTSYGCLSVSEEYLQPIETLINYKKDAL